MPLFQIFTQGTMIPELFPLLWHASRGRAQKKVAFEDIFIILHLCMWRVSVGIKVNTGRIPVRFGCRLESGVHKRLVNVTPNAIAKNVEIQCQLYLNIVFREG